jgi:hypothetical protein
VENAREKSVLRGGVCAVVIVDIVIASGSLVLIGHIAWVGE